MKIKNTFFKGKMNKDVDERLVPEGEYIDALNVRVLNTSGSDAGAIENERGNEKVTFMAEENNPVCIGSVSDEANEKIYWFVVNDLGHSFIYEYSAKTKLVTTVLADTRPSNVLNFNKDYKITGVNIIYNIYNKKYLMVFTDGLNPPRCINIERSKGYGENGFQEDDINLYKKAPRTAPSVVGYNTLDVSENNVKERYFAFSYRYKYLDGEYSPLSSFTGYQFTPSNFLLDYDTMENKGMVNVFNSYRIEFNVGDERVTDVQVCFKNPNNNTVYVIDTINKKENNYLDGSIQSLIFNNKKIYSALPEDELNRMFDDIPITAKAQDFVENRLIFGNTSTQYDILDAEDGDPIQVDYYVDKLSIESAGSDGTRTISGDSLTITLDLSNLSLQKGFIFYLGASIASDEAGTAPNLYYGGSHLGQAAVTLTNTYTDASSFILSDDFQQFLDTLNASFINAVETEPYPNSTQTQYGQYSVSTSSSTTIVLSAPTITYTVDNTPADPNDNDFSTEIEQFKWQEETVFSLRETNSLQSLKSNRSYEIGISYLDKYGRYSSIIPTANKTRSEAAELFVPPKDSININRAQVTVNSKPPYWADRYKFFIKTNKKEHYTLYATTFYEEGVYRWVMLTGNNLYKVEPGTNLIVKSDDFGPLIDEVKVKVLDVVTKTKADLNQSSETKANEGWLEDNRNAADQPIKELYGTFMKIKPVGFQMDFNPYNFSYYEGSGKIKYGLNSNNRGFVECLVPRSSQKNIGLGQFLDDNGQLFNVQLTEGTKIIFDISSFESIDLNNNSSREFKREYILGDTYTGDNTTSGLEKFFIGETTWYKPSGETYYTDPNDQFKIYFLQETLPEGVRHYAKIVSTEETGLLERAYINASIQVIVNPEGTLIFETDPKELDSDVYYETPQTFEIVNGLHKGNEQDQTSTDPAICTLSVGNCFSFGNGVESMQVRDERLADSFNFDLRPNIVLVDGYKKRNLTNTLTFSGPINPSTSYNTINEFNASRGISKLLDAKYGSIQRIASRDSDLIVFQEDKVQKVLYGKSLVYSSDGTASLTTIEDVLGKEVPFTGEYGISKNPESLSIYGGRMYFTDASRGTVLRLGNDGLTPISYYGMRSYFKENLFNYKDSYNIGGFDPNSHQYVLSMNQSSFPAESFVFDCSSNFTIPISSGESFSYGLNVDNIGTLGLSYVVNGNVDISITSLDSSQNNTSLTGSGSLSFEVYPTAMDAEPEVQVVITANEDSLITMTHSCPVYVTRDMDLMVLTDINLAGQTIQNSYRINNGSDLSHQDVFSSTGITRKDTFTDSVESPFIPKDGDTVTVTSTKVLGVHTADFNEYSAIGYLISPDAKTNSEIAAEATYPTVTKTIDGQAVNNSITFTFNETSPNDKLYLIWSYGFAGTVDDPDSGSEEGGGDKDPITPSACTDNIHTFYIGGGAAQSIADLQASNWNVSTSVNAESAVKSSNLNTVLCKDGSEFSWLAAGYWIVLTQADTNFDPSGGFDWWYIDTDGTVSNTGYEGASGGGSQ